MKQPIADAGPRASGPSSKLPTSDDTARSSSLDAKDASDERDHAHAPDEHGVNLKPTASAVTALLHPVRAYLVTKPGTGEALRECISRGQRGWLLDLLAGGGVSSVSTKMGVYLKAKKETHFVVLQCCAAFVASGAYAARQIVYAKGTKRTELSLRRYPDRILIAKDDRSLHWQNAAIQHDPDCPIDKGLSAGKRQSRQGGGGGGQRRRALDKDLSVGRPMSTRLRPSRKSARKKTDARSSARQGPINSRESRLLLTAVADAALNIVNRTSSPGADMKALLGAAVNLGRSNVAAALISGTWAVNLSPDSAAIKSKLDALATHLDENTSPTLDLVVILRDVRTDPCSELGWHTAEIKQTETGARTIALPPAVKFWRDGRTTKSTVFLALLQVGLDLSGDVEIIGGYGHPICSEDFLCPIDSDEEKTIVVSVRKCFFVRPDGFKNQYRIEKPIFARRFGKSMYTLDLLVFRLSSADEVLEFSLEHLGYPKNKQYVEGKFTVAEHVASHSKHHVLSVASKPLCTMPPEGLKLIANREIAKELSARLIQPSLFGT